jgi:Sec-independent protein secretion pathway component TatC
VWTALAFAFAFTFPFAFAFSFGRTAGLENILKFTKWLIDVMLYFILVGQVRLMKGFPTGRNN